MDLNAVEMFVNVVQTGSLSAAAQRLGVPLPTLSRKMRELEQQLSVQLLERTARGTKLTDAGTRLYEHASRGIESLVDAREAVLSSQAQLKGYLRLSLPPSFEPWWAVLDAFQQRYPGIRVFVYSTERRVDLTADGIDVALRVGAIDHELMVARKMFAYRHVLVASRALVERLGPPVTPDDLNRYPCAAWMQNSYARPLWRLGNATFQPKPLISTNDYAHLRFRVLRGEAATELPPYLVADDVKAGHVVALLPDYPLPLQEINLLYPSHRHPSSIVRAYLDFCQERLRGDAADDGPLP
ncbi:LysR family transcriptional regulator [Paraburkholderia sp. PGU19]|uniref:LysR family transcriptional regulator n=1 Tax=Paraburkholderia sp. PGU19 TaxID=2735434 RepID=UPI0015DA4353|nr:LysR family transcriptional regulator [Paraburkholderia sp. PGU19]BCG00201.1 LysR family transcriptional regulator [Paraburkholderia sp. PGU19]